jgi:ATP-binding cassette, subfamily B, bacterial
MRLTSLTGDALNFHLYRRVLREARPFWPYILGLALTNLLATPLALLTPVPLKIAVDSIAGAAPYPELYRRWLPQDVLASPLAVLVVTAMLMVAIEIVSTLQGFVTWLLETYTGERMVLAFRAKLFRHVQRLSLSYHDMRGSAGSLYHIQYDAPAIPDIATSCVLPFVSATFTLVAMLYVVGRIDWLLAVIAVATTPFLFGILRVRLLRLKGSARLLKRLDSTALSVVQEVLTSIRVVKAFSREDYEHERFVTKSEERLEELRKQQVLQMRFDLATTVVMAAASALTLSIGVIHVRAGSLTLGNLLLAMGYLGRLHDPLRTMSKRAQQLQSALAGAERAFAVLDEAPDVRDQPNARAMSRAVGAIEFRGVSFGYERDHPVLRDVSFRVPSGARVGIAGPTGAGKTTLLTLLTRFYDPTSGQILLDGFDLRDLRLVDLRNQFAILHQDSVLLSATISENVLYGRPGASQADIEAAARAANAHEFIMKLPDGYDTLVGERGMRLSGGERQRVALARAFLKNAPVLLLDEPTSAVDVKTEAVIMEALNRLMVGRTTFMIAHRLSTLEGCDILIAVADGRVAVQTGAVEPQVMTS